MTQATFDPLFKTWENERELTDEHMEARDRACGSYLFHMKYGMMLRYDVWKEIHYREKRSKMQKKLAC